MFEIDKDDEETLIYKSGKDVKILNHNFYDGSVGRKNGKKIGFWDGKKITKGDEDSELDSELDSESESHEDESESESEDESENESENERKMKVKMKKRMWR